MGDVQPTHFQERRISRIVAVQVTDENMADVAEWCGGSVVTKYERPFVATSNSGPCQAFVGDWVYRWGPGIFDPIRDAELHELFVACPPPPPLPPVSRPERSPDQ